MVAFAGVGQMPKCPDHVFELSRAKLELSDVIKRHFFDVRAASPLVTPELQEFAHLFNGKAEVPGAANEAKAMDIARRIVPVPALGPTCFRYEINGLVVPDHLGGDA